MRLKNFYFNCNNGRQKRICVALIDTINEFDKLSVRLEFSRSAILPSAYAWSWSEPGQSYGYWRIWNIVPINRDGDDLSWRQLRYRIAKPGIGGNKCSRLWPKDEFGHGVDAVAFAKDVRVRDNF